MKPSDIDDEKISLGFMEHKNTELETRLIEKFSGDDTRLNELEEVISHGLSKFLEVGAALLEIRDSKIYRRAGYGTFADYCRKRWALSRVVAYRVIAAHEVVTNLSPIGYKTPENDAQARVLSDLEPEEQRMVWKQAVETAPEGKITASHVATVKSGFGFPVNQQSNEQLKRKEQQSAWKTLWQWIKAAITLKPKSAADNCPDAKAARAYINESEKAVAIIRQYQTQLKKRFKL